MAASNAADDVLRLLAKIPETSGFKRIVNLASGLPEDLFVTSKLSKPSDIGAEMSKFVQKIAEAPRAIDASQFPEVAKRFGLQPVEGIVYGYPGKVREVSDKAMRQMEQNIEAIMDAEFLGRKGDTRFYHDLNRLLGESAPSLDRTTAAYTFAPFSAGSPVRENVRRWQRLVENPELFPGRIKPEGGQTVGGAWQDALRIIGKETPSVKDLSTSGQVVKIGSFGENIADPTGSMRATIDRHAVKNALGLYMPDVLTPDLSDEATYRVFEKAFQNVAARRGIMPNEAQSAAWDTWRRINQANPDEGMIQAADFVPLQVSELFSMPADARREALKYLLGTVSGKDAAFLKRAGLA